MENVRNIEFLFQLLLITKHHKKTKNIVLTLFTTFGIVYDKYIQNGNFHVIKQ